MLVVILMEARKKPVDSPSQFLLHYDPSQFMPASLHYDPSRFMLAGLHYDVDESGLFFGVAASVHVECAPATLLALFQKPFFIRLHVFSICVDHGAVVLPLVFLHAVFWVSGRSSIFDADLLVFDHGDQRLFVSCEFEAVKRFCTC